MFLNSFEESQSSVSRLQKYKISKQYVVGHVTMCSFKKLPQFYTRLVINKNNFLTKFSAFSPARKRVILNCMFVSVTLHNSNTGGLILHNATPLRKDS